VFALLAGWLVLTGRPYPPAEKGKKFGAALLQTRVFAAPHKKEDRPHPQQQKCYLVDLQVGSIHLFVRGCKPLWFAAVLHQIFFPEKRVHTRMLLPIPASRPAYSTFYVPTGPRHSSLSFIPARSVGSSRSGAHTATPPGRGIPSWAPRVWESGTRSSLLMEFGPM
jgi:hypothetical protein